MLYVLVQPGGGEETGDLRSCCTGPEGSTLRVFMCCLFSLFEYWYNYGAVNKRKLDGDSRLFDRCTGRPIQAHLRTVHLRIAELERAVGTFSVKGSSGGGGSKSDPADVEQRLVDLFKEKWARAAAER